jgi:hypothetical protein
MKPDSMNSDVRQLVGRRKYPAAKPTKEDLNVAKEREQNAGMIQHSGDATVKADTETGRFTSGLTPHYAGEELIHGRTPIDAALQRPAQSGRVSRYAAAEIVCREDPW